MNCLDGEHNRMNPVMVVVVVVHHKSMKLNERDIMKDFIEMKKQAAALIHEYY